MNKYISSHLLWESTQTNSSAAVTFVLTVSSEECLRSLIGAAALDDGDDPDPEVDVLVGSLSDPDMDE
jgi:hypothetical protein